MRKPHRKQLLAWLLTAALLLTHLPVSVLSEEIIEAEVEIGKKKSTLIVPGKITVSELMVDFVNL